MTLLQMGSARNAGTHLIAAGEPLSVAGTLQPETWWSKCKFGCISLAISLTETFIVYGGVFLVQTSKQPHAPPLIVNVAGAAFLLGSIGSLGFAITGLVADSRRATAFVALVVTMATFLGCGLQMLV
jgi:hypothetical protein